MNIFVLGDSISIHYGPFLERYLAGSMGYARKSGEEEALKNLDVPCGANGGDSSMVLAYLRAQKKFGTFPHDLLMLNCGLHDIKTDVATGQKQVPLELYQKNLQEIIQCVQTLQTALVWLRTTPVVDIIHNKPDAGFHRFASDVDVYNSAADALMKDAGIPVIDLYAFTQNMSDDRYCDHVHFKEHVQEKQAAFIAGWLMAFKSQFQ